jgi:hypothetical protein
MTTTLRDALIGDDQRRVLASIDSAARQVALEDRHADIQQAIDRLPPNAKKWALDNTCAFCDLIEFYKTEVWRDLGRTQ